LAHVICYRARYVAPITAPPLVDGIVAVDAGRIAYVGPAAAAPPGRAVDLGNALLLPGLVNAHTHLELTAMRGFLEDLDFRSWILRLTTAKRAVLTRDMLLDAARYGIDEGLKHGITTYADTCDSGVAFDAMRERGVRGVMYQEVFGPDPAQCAASLAELREKVDRLRPLETTLVRLGVSPHAPYTVSDSLFAAVGRYAREAALPVAIHIAESRLEEDLVVRAEGAFADGLRARAISVAPRARSSIQLLADLDVLTAHPLLIHCVRADEKDIAIVARARCSMAHCPASNAKLGHGIAPLSAFIAAGVPVGLGSDSVASNNRMDILEEARLAALVQRGSRGDFSQVNASTAITLATLGGARALGIEGEVGSLDVGKAADLAAFPLGSLAPVHDPLASAVFGLPGTQATFVAVAGRELLRDGVLLDEDPSLEGRVQSAAGAMQAWLRTAPENPSPTGTATNTR
jgi:cytosine/adenosine deaminase-related metal-dependent hydrolase